MTQVDTTSGSVLYSTSASPASQSVARGTSATYTVTITPAEGFAEPVTLSMSGLPAGTSASFSPNPATSFSQVTVTTARKTKPGTYTLTIAGASGALSRTTTVTLTVTR